MLGRVKSLVEPKKSKGMTPYYISKIEELEIKIVEKRNNLRRLEAQRNEMNNQVRALKEEYSELTKKSGSIAEVNKMISDDKCLVGRDGKMVVGIDRKVDKTELKANTRVNLAGDEKMITKILPSLIDPMVSLMKIEKVPDSTYDMIGGLEQ